MTLEQASLYLFGAGLNHVVVLLLFGDNVWCLSVTSLIKMRCTTRTPRTQVTRHRHIKSRLREFYNFPRVCSELVPPAQLHERHWIADQHQQLRAVLSFAQSMLKSLYGGNVVLAEVSPSFVGHGDVYLVQLGISRLQCMEYITFAGTNAYEKAAPILAESRQTVLLGQTWRDYLLLTSRLHGCSELAPPPLWRCPTVAALRRYLVNRWLQLGVSSVTEYAHEIFSFRLPSPCEMGVLTSDQRRPSQVTQRTALGQAPPSGSASVGLQLPRDSGVSLAPPPLHAGRRRSGACWGRDWSGGMNCLLSSQPREEYARRSQQPTDPRNGDLVRRLARQELFADGANQSPFPEPAALAYFLLFFDGRPRGNPGPGGAGSVVVPVGATTTQHEVVLVSMSYSGKHTNNNTADYLGLLHGIRRA